MFEHIETLTLRAIFTAEQSGSLPLYLGSTLRGALGHCLRSYVCQSPNIRCHLCDRSPNCTYARNFCSPGNEAGAVNPFVLHALTRDKSQWNRGDACQFEVTLIGETAREAGLFVDAIQEMGTRGWGAVRLPFRLQQIMDPVRNAIVWNGGKTWMRNCRPLPLMCQERPANAAVVRFDTPVRILVKRNLCRALSFADLIQSVSRRLALLSLAYAGQRIAWEEEALLEAALKIKTAAEEWTFVDFERYSMTRGGKLPLAAIEGWARFEGDLTPFTPILAAGERLHAGKNATIGFGHYSVSYDR